MEETKYGKYIVRKLKSNIKEVDENNFQIPKALVDLIIKTSEENQRFFDSINYLTKILKISK